VRHAGRIKAMRNMYTILTGKPEEKDHFQDLDAVEG
jgi:hypothetical protein